MKTINESRCCPRILVPLFCALLFGCSSEKDPGRDAILILGGQIDTFSVSITAWPVHEQQLLLNLTLHHSPIQVIFVEPPSIWPNGRPVSAHAFIDKGVAFEILDLADSFELFRCSEVEYVSFSILKKVAQDRCKGTLPDGSLAVERPSIEFSFSASNVYGGTSFRATLPFDGGGREFAERVVALLSAEARELMEELLLQFS